MIIDQDTMRYMIESMKGRKELLESYVHGSFDKDEILLKERIDEINRAIEYFTSFLLK